MRCTAPSVVVVGALCALMAGCKSPDRTMAYRRVCVIEFYNRTQYAETARELTDALAKELAIGVDGTDVVSVRQADLPSLGGRDPLKEGTVPVELFAEVRDRCKADAFVIGAVDSHNPYPPPSVHITMKMMEVASGNVIYSLSREWDGASDMVYKEVEGYYDENRDRDEFRWGPNMFVTSPRYFMMFVAHAVAADIIRSL